VQPKFDKIPPQKKPTIKTVADAAGVSTATVSNTFNRPDQLSAEVGRTTEFASAVRRVSDIAFFAIKMGGGR